MSRREDREISKRRRSEIDQARRNELARTLDRPAAEPAGENVRRADPVIGEGVFFGDRLTGQSRDARLRLRVGDHFSGESGRVYRWGEAIGQGGTARVNAVYDSTERMYAAKWLSGHRFEVTREMEERFAREARALGSINSPRVVRLEDIASIPGYGTVLVLEFLSGGSLYERLKRAERPSLPVVLSWIEQTLRGLEVLHDANFVHRDVTPRNLLFRDDDSIVVADFGTVRHLDDATLTAEADKIGSLVYIPAEQFDDPHRASASADVFAVGQIAYELVAGRKPHGNALPMTAATGMLNGVDSALGGALARWIEGLRSYDESARPANAGAALSGLLTAVASGRPGASTSDSRGAVDHSYDVGEATRSMLSEREAEVARYLLLGMTYREIGARLHVSAKTIEQYVARIRRLTGAGSRSEMLSILRAAGYGPDVSS